MKMTITEFCRKHEACRDGAKWALENCQNMDDVWENAKPEWLVWVATCEGVLPDKELRLFTVWCARRVQHLMTDDRSIAAVDVAERYANGNATLQELNAAREAAREAKEADWAAMSAWVATGLAWEASWWAAVSVAEAAWADSDEAMDAAYEAALEGAWAAQAQYLRENYKPNFEI